MATIADLNLIKDRIRDLLLSANTTTASPVDLSNGLANTQRVKQVLKINPQMIVPQPSFFPLVSCFVESKNILRDDIAKDQLNTKRRALITLSIVGTIWNDNYVSLDEDPSDEDINSLMENIELIMRSDPNLGGAVNWQKPGDVSYYTSILDEQTHLRSGVLKLECQVWY
jgi:hypothetical protein